MIALVGSAGGIQAAGDVLAGFAADLSAAVIVAIHQGPGRPTEALASILARRSALPVSLAVDDEALVPGRVVVVPPGHHLIVAADRRTRLLPAGPYPPNRPSADLLLTTLATTVGAAAIGVVLSGAGQDGATGATAIYAFDGTVLTTDEPSTAIFGMPRATIQRDHPDSVLPLDAIADAVTRRTSDDALGPT